MKRLLVRALLALDADRWSDRLASLITQIRLARYARHGVTLRFVPQGGYDIEIAGDLARFRIGATSHLKSATFIECSGGVTIGEYFHVGRGLTIFSTNHNYLTANKIPYDEVALDGPVEIGDFVWCGANVIILPGVTVGEGAVLAAGSVVTKSVPPMAVVAGNPARVVKYRDAERFAALKAAGSFF